MLKLTISVNDVVVMEQTGCDATIASFTHDPVRTLNTIQRQGWYGLVSEHDGITTLYKITPAYNETFLPQEA